LSKLRAASAEQISCCHGLLAHALAPVSDQRRGCVAGHLWCCSKGG